MNPINKIVKESGINFTGSVIGNLLGYIWLMVMTRYLSQDDVGSFTLAQSIINISLVFVVLGTHRSLDRFIPVFNTTGESGKIKSLIRMVFELSVVGSLVIGLLIFLGSDYLGRQVFDNPTLAGLLRIIVYSIPLLVVTLIVSYAFTGYKELRYHVYLKQFLEPVLKIVLMIFAAVLGISVFQWTWLYNAALLITAIAGLWILRKNIFQPLANIPALKIEVREIISYSWPISIASILIIIIGQIDYLILGVFHPAANVGVYRIYIQIAALLQLILGSTARIYKPVISELISKDDYSDIQDTYQRVSKWVFFLTMLGFLVIMLYGSRLTSLLFTEKYAVYPLALTILALGTLINAMFGPEGMTLEAFGNTKLVLINSLVMVFTNVGLGFLLIPDYGIVGAAISTGATLAIGGFLGYLEISYLYKMQPFSRATLKCLAIGLVAGGVFYGIDTWIKSENILLLLLMILLLIGFYLTGLFLSRSMDKVEVQFIQKTIKNIRSKS
ncbi:MAG: flippase [Anaerolineales bacterium]|nr:flippase [Anaerolineales bacterium]